MVEQSPKPNKEANGGTYLINLQTRLMLGDASALKEILEFTLHISKHIQQTPGLSGGKEGGGVQLKDWSAKDQQRMLNGQRPQGIPDHRNI